MRWSTFILTVLAMLVSGYLYFRAAQGPEIRDPTPILARR